MDIQKHLFEIVRGQINPGLSMAEVISDILNINIAAVYRRLKGDTKLSIDEVVDICAYFNISVDYVLRMSAKNLVFRYNPVDLSQLDDSYYSYISDFSGIFTKLAGSREKQMLTLAHDIPLFHLMAYPEMSFFKLYAWNQSVSSKRITYEEFIRGIDTERIAYYHGKVADSMKQVPSTEIWSHETIIPQIDLVEYYFDMECFEDRGTPLLLCRQLLSLVTDMEQWVEQGGRDLGGRLVPFSLYGSPLKMMPNFSVGQEDGLMWGFMHLYGTQCMITSSNMFCMEMDKFLRSIMTKSLFINGASLRERRRIFNDQKNKIERLAGKIAVSC